MKPQYATEQLIEMIQRACSVPTSQLTYTNADWAAMATDMLQTIVVPLIMSTREDYFVKFKNVLSPADGFVEFPGDAVGSKMRNVCFISQENPLVLINLPRIDLDVVAGVGFFNTWTLAGFYIQGEYIVLYPNTSVPVNTPLRLYYYRRTLALAAPEQYGRVESVDAMTNTIVLDSLPSDWEVGDTINTIGSEPNFLVTCESAEITAVSNPALVLDTVEGIEVGDYMSLEGYSAIPQIPVEAHNYLAQCVATIALEGLGDREGMSASQEVAERLKTALLVMISQRVDGSPKKVINPSGGLRIGSGGFRRGWGF